jgi:hypothetical protein
MSIRKHLLGFATVSALALGAHGAMALPIPFQDNFDYVSTGSTSSFGSWVVMNQSPSGQASNVDTLNSPYASSFGVTCHGGAGGCVDLDGSNATNIGPMVVSGTFSLLAGHTYTLSAYISGNQRPLYGPASDDVYFGFLSSDYNVTPSTFTGSVLIQNHTGALDPNSPFALYSVSYTAGSNVDVKVGFVNNSIGAVSDFFGAILDDVSVADITAVPLPASAWLLLTGLLALGLVSRRGVAGGLAR